LFTRVVLLLIFGLVAVLGFVSGWLALTHYLKLVEWISLGLGEVSLVLAVFAVLVAVHTDSIVNKLWQQEAPLLVELGSGVEALRKKVVTPGQSVDDDLRPIVDALRRLLPFLSQTPGGVGAVRDEVTNVAQLLKDQPPEALKEMSGTRAFVAAAEDVPGPEGQDVQELKEKLPPSGEVG
jgi:hypothetical protein